MVLEKIDKENKVFVEQLNLSTKQKKIAIKSMDELENNLHAFFVQQRKEYLSAIKSLPKLLKKKKIKKSQLADDSIEEFADIISEYIFANDKAHIEQLEEIYHAFSNATLAQIAELGARSIEGCKLGSTMTLSKKATEWISKHKILFAQAVNKTTHDAVISSIKATLAENKGIVVGSNDLMSRLPKFFNQDKLKSKEKRLKTITDVDLYNKMYQKVEKQKCFEFYRARRISQTETNTAANAGTLEGYRQSEVVKEKEWMCAGSGSRAWHRQADGQKVSIDEPFIVNGEELMHPGDTSFGASAKNVIHCRCSMRAVIN